MKEKKVRKMTTWLRTQKSVENILYVLDFEPFVVNYGKRCMINASEARLSGLQNFLLKSVTIRYNNRSKKGVNLSLNSPSISDKVERTG
ncbi:MAG: hypothetical protein JSW00_18710 [Thermoplasmata archaeon]|nr:MAG: hypothetical protein JSW00_18710 [Thermoplasmata archaeon]